MQAHHDRVILAMRAALNARQALHTPLLCHWLDHRSEAVSTETAAALEVHTDSAVEAALVGKRAPRPRRDFAHLRRSEQDTCSIARPVSQPLLLRACSAVILR